MVTATNKATGELVELDTSTFEKVVEAWRVASEYEKLATALKDQLKLVVPIYINSSGTSDAHKGYMFRRSEIQRMTYDKAVMRKVFDEDMFDVFMKPDKTKIDEYIKEHLEELGDDSTLLRTNMLADGKAYTVIKLERLDRDAK